MKRLMLSMTVLAAGMLFAEPKAQYIPADAEIVLCLHHAGKIAPELKEVLPGGALTVLPGGEAFLQKAGIDPKDPNLITDVLFAAVGNVAEGKAFGYAFGSLDAKKLFSAVAKEPPANPAETFTYTDGVLISVKRTPDGKETSSGFLALPSGGFAVSMDAKDLPALKALLAGKAPSLPTGSPLAAALKSRDTQANLIVMVRDLSTLGSSMSNPSMPNPLGSVGLSLLTLNQKGGKLNLDVATIVKTPQTPAGLAETLRQQKTAVETFLRMSLGEKAASSSLLALLSSAKIREVKRGVAISLSADPATLKAVGQEAGILMMGMMMQGATPGQGTSPAVGDSGFPPSGGQSGRRP